MKYLKFISHFLLVFAVCMLPVYLGGAVPFTSSFGLGVAVSLALALIFSWDLYCAIVSQSSRTQLERHNNDD